MMFALRMAWRESRAARNRFAFIVGAVALGVAALTGIKGFSESLDRAMSRSAKDLIAADLSVRLNSAPGADERAILDSLVARGAQMTETIETLSMASPAGAPTPVLSTIKAVDPDLYPFYGSLEVDPALPLRQLLTDGSAIVTRELLVRTGSALGDTLQIGAAQFRMTAVLKGEPDRIASGIEIGPRVLITVGGLKKAALLQFGSRASHTFLYRLPAAGLSLESARALLKAGFTRPVRISDFRDPNPSVSRGLERMTEFLSLIGLLALLVGGLGVGTSMHTYLQQRLETIAILKCVGARSKQIIAAYLVQGLALGVIGSVAGIALGYAVQRAFPTVLQGLLRLPTRLEAAPGAALQGLLIGVTTTLLFLVPPLLAIRRISPVRVFLREMPETRYSTLGRLRRDPVPLISGLVLVFGVVLLASWLAGSWFRGVVFVGSLLGAILVLGTGAQIMLAALKRVPRPPSLLLRYGLRNLNRPGSHVTSILVALGIGVAFVVTVYLIQSSLLTQIVKSAPADFPNLFLLGITERDKAPLWDFLKARPEVREAGKPIPAVPARLERIDGKTADEMNLEAPDRRYARIEFTLTWGADVPPDTRITEGHWWGQPFNEPLISVGQSAARWLKIHVGSTLEFSSSGTIIRGRVANIRDMEFSRPGSNNQFIFSPGALDGLPASYVGGLRVDESKVAELQKALFARFPNVSSLDVGQVLVRVQDLLDRIATVIRFIAAFAIVAGMIILASSVAATRYQRNRETVLLKTLGATRSQVAGIQATEFLVIGLAAGLIGSLLAAAAAYFLLGHLLNTDFRFRWLPFSAAILSTAGLTVATGWLASRGILNHKPLEILREN